MKRRICAMISCFVVLLSTFGNGVKVNAQEDSVTFDNDGTAISKPYGKCSVKPSFKGDYYDCYIPYKLTCKNIGGYSEDMNESDQSNKVSAKFNWEDDISMPYTKSFTDKYAGEYERGYCPETDVTTYTDKYGTSFYMCAIPFFMYANNLAGSSGFPGWGMENRGQVYDLILTDGTVLHFIVGDAKSKSHTNGCDDGTSLYTLEKLNHIQYKYLFQSYAGETFELFGKSGCVAKFMDKYNIGSSEGKNQVAYVRMYNLRLRDGIVERESGIPEGTGYSLGEVKVSKTDTNYDGINIIPEYLLTGMPEVSKLPNSGVSVGIVSRDDLSIKENYSLQVTKDSVDTRNAVRVYDIARYIMAFVGLLLLSYSLLFFLSFAFDRVNSFIDISMVSLITFGSINVCSKQESINKEGYISYTKFYISIGVLVAVACLLISGAVIPWIMRTIIYIVSFFRN